MKGVIISLCLLLSSVLPSVLWADQATFDARLETISALASAKRCYTLQNSGMTSIEFARLRAICWKAQLGDDWAARNPVYQSRTLSNLPAPLSAEDKARLVREKAEREATLAKKTACEALSSDVFRWNAEQRSCQCRNTDYTLRDGQCLSPLTLQLERQRQICLDAGPEVERTPDPDHPGMEIICRLPRPRTPSAHFTVCRPGVQSNLGTFDINAALGLPPQPAADTHCVVNLGRNVLEHFHLDSNHNDPPVDPELRDYLDSVVLR
ncbi:MAG: hypothetical protein AABY86_04795 [Bdellovibrionota bacterium]